MYFNKILFEKFIPKFNLISFVPNWNFSYPSNSTKSTCLGFFFFLKLMSSFMKKHRFLYNNLIKIIIINIIKTYVKEVFVKFVEWQRFKKGACPVRECCHLWLFSNKKWTKFYRRKLKKSSKSELFLEFFIIQKK